MDDLKINILVDGSNYDLNLFAFVQACKKIGAKIVVQARANLATQDKIVTGTLADGLYFSLTETDDGLTMEFKGHAPYYDFVEQGVQGAASSAKAPDSPYRFGSGTGQKGTLQPAIRKWIVDRGISNQTWRDAKGRFLSFDTMSRWISRSVYLTGIKPSYYYSMAIDETLKQAIGLLQAGIEKDIDIFLKDNFARTYEITITI